MNTLRTYKQRLIELAILVAVVGLLVAAMVVSGIMPVKASSGHWAITEATLQFASKRSIQTNSLGIEVPPLNEPGMIRLGAATYESNCAWCHGSPLAPEPVVPAAMTPKPPSLNDSGDKWEARELFYIAKHGIMFTGMPAWPTQARDDEIWPVVAFLQALGSMDKEQYGALLQSKAVSGVLSSEVQAMPSLMASCLDCHGSDGSSVVGARVPELQQLSPEYMAMTMHAMRGGERPSGIMQPIVARLRDEQVDEIAGYFEARKSEQSRGAEVEAVDATFMEQDADDITEDINDDSLKVAASTVEAGMKLIQQGSAERKIAACIECHGRERSMASYPSLVGQSPVYIRIQLELYASGARRGGQASLMHDIAEKLDETERIQVSEAFSRWVSNSGKPE